MSTERLHAFIREELDLPDDMVLLDDTRIVDDLGADSLDLIELILAAEDEFDTDFSEIENSIKTVGDLRKHIEDHE